MNDIPVFIMNCILIANYTECFSLKEVYITLFVDRVDYHRCTGLLLFQVMSKVLQPH